MRRELSRLFAVVVLVLSTTARVARADEGMWPLDAVPVKPVAEKFGLEIDGPWLERVKRASVRLSSGGSGGFVSNQGLVVTNHHVVAACIQKLGEQKGARDLMREGFLSARREEEARCPELEAHVLLRIDDVTEDVIAAVEAVDPALGEAAVEQARRRTRARIQDQCTSEAPTGTRRCEVVPLFGGARHHLYRFARYRDVRLVFAPEAELAAFGGDAENFTYPRHAFDVAFLRVYADGAPLATPDFFPFSRTPPSEGDLTLTAGSPGSTDRLAPFSKLELLRTVVYPSALDELRRTRDALARFSATGPARERAARTQLRNVENSIKALSGYLSGLEDKTRRKAALAREKKLLRALEQIRDKKERRRLLEAFPKLRRAHQRSAELNREHIVLDGRFGASGRLAQLARHLVRLGTERSKPSGERRPEYNDANLASLEPILFSEAPIDLELEVELLALGLDAFSRNLSKTRVAAHRALGLSPAMSPRARAEALIRGTRLVDVATRRALFAGGEAAIAASDDPLIALFRALEPDAARLRETWEAEVSSVEARSEARVAEAYGKFGGVQTPDATGTLRLNLGTVRGWTSTDGAVAWKTTFGEMFEKWERAKGDPSFALPKRWLDARLRIDPKAPLDFVSTNDAIGGSSGSPTFDRAGKLVGVVFDVNVPQLENRFVYREGTGRTIHVDATGVLHALLNVYDATELVKELTP